MQRPVFLDRGRAIGPSIWVRVRTWARLHAFGLRIAVMIFAWALILFAFGRSHLIFAILFPAIAIALTIILDWRTESLRLRRMREETTAFKSWFDRMQARAIQYNITFYPDDPVFRQYWREGLTPDQAFDIVKDGAAKAAAKHAGRHAPKITRLSGPEY